MTKEDDAAQLAKTVHETFGRCDILVNNPGLYPFTPLMDISLNEWRKVMSINLDGPFLISKALIPLMKANKRGRIINITSSECWMVAANNAHYIASKMGVVGFTRALATELAEFGITANAVGPVLTKTATIEHTAKQYTETLPQLQAIKRLKTPTDLVGAVSFLASQDAGFLPAKH